jgi:LPXTG-motif cell wall-anchored protein
MSPSSFGFFEILGLPLGTYYLYETAAPEGYSQLAAPQEILIENDGYGWGYTISPRANVPNNGFIANEWLQYIWAVAIQNNRSSMFPETGGIGTGIYLLIGTVIMISSGTAMIIYRKHKNRNYKERTAK